MGRHRIDRKSLSREPDDSYTDSSENEMFNRMNPDAGSSANDAHTDLPVGVIASKARTTGLPGAKRAPRVRSSSFRKARAQVTGIHNAKAKRWSNSDTRVVISKHAEGMGWAKIAREYLPKYHPNAIASRWNGLPKGADGHPILEDFPSDDEGDGMPVAHGKAGSKAEKILRLLGVEPLSARVARIFPDKMLEGLRGGHPHFMMLHEGLFSDYAEILHDWRVGLGFYARLTRHGPFSKPYPLPALSVLSWNDWQAQTEGAVGRFRMDCGVGDPHIMYLADIAWTPPEQSEWRQAVPRQRMHWSGAFLHWHWSDPRTLVLPILMMHSEDSDDGPFFRMSLTPAQWDDAVAGKDSGPCVLLVDADMIYFTSFVQLARCMVRDEECETIGTCSNYRKDDKKRSVMEWRLFTGSGTYWSGERVLSVGDTHGHGGTLSSQVIDKLVAVHRLLRDNKGRQDGVCLKEWGDVFEGLHVGA